MLHNNSHYGTNPEAYQKPDNSDVKNKYVRSGSYHPVNFQLDSNKKKYKNKQYTRKEILYIEQTHIEYAFLIKDGLVKLVNYLPDGRSRIVRLNGKHRWLGLEGLLKLPYSHTAIAVSPVTIEIFPLSHLQTLMKLNTHFNQLINLQWHQNLRQADKWIAEFSTGSIKSRVARLVNFLSTIESNGQSIVVELLTVQEMADIVGASPESVSRTLANFKRLDLLKRCTDKLKTLYQIDLHKLEQEAAL